ncbi:beta-galactosidase [Catalinimonas alkaloidigena]|uniref:Beta-galactosidase n=1 Tax=Catalinimonas alkaloidigena TaxID=1075417 RepID=A0A1G9H0G1_9BACT|nr:beta-galactosidase GalA [Catalinimonas alkaloidigena]SDL06359.1 beta-galactosidase [Catalinimonas alkaloidigena]
MMHRTFCLFFGLLGLVAPTASCFAQTVPRQKTLFDNDWKFHFGHAADPQQDFDFTVANIFSKSGKAVGTAIDPRFADSTWQTLQLPHDWAVQLPFVEVDNFDVMAHGYKPVGGLFPETSIGWYRKHFQVARADSGQRFVIEFDGVFRDSQIWLNGFYLGNHPSGYTGVAYDLTDYLRYGEANVLVVRVDATQYEGWFYEGAGIYRHVWLHQYDPLHIPLHGVFVHAKVEGPQAIVTVEASVENETDTPVEGTVAAYLLDRDGKRLAESKADFSALPAHDTQTVVQHLTLPTPHLWSLDDPYRYRMVTEIQRNNKVVDRVETRFGVRTIEITPDRGMFLNGQHVMLQGVNCHQDHAGVGSAVPDALQYYRIRLLKEMGVNAYRASHNPPTPELLDACDSLGMLVMDENRLLNSSPAYLQQLEDLIVRDRNHPSVFMWSIGNEEPSQTSAIGRRIAQTLLQKQRELDPTRTSTYAADLANVYKGINEVIPVRGFNYRHEGVAPYHADHPEQPLVGTEMGSTVTTRGIYVVDSIRGYVPDYDSTHPWWSSTAEAWWTEAAAHPYWMGGFIWTGFDYRGEPTPYAWPNINSHFGVMDVCGFPKNIYYYYQSWWTDEDVLHLTPHWNWPGREGQPIKVWVNTNAETVELFLNGKSLGTKTMPRNEHLEWMVPYQPGKLEAVALKDGRKIRKKMETTGAAYRIVLTPDRTTLTPDGRDATVLNVSVQDKKGREVPDAQHLIRFSLDGTGRMLGVGNGDPSSHEPDQCPDGQWQRHLFNGKCQLIVQAGTQPGTFTIGATAEGLKAASVVIQMP